MIHLILIIDMDRGQSNLNMWTLAPGQHGFYPGFSCFGCVSLNKLIVVGLTSLICENYSFIHPAHLLLTTLPCVGDASINKTKKVSSFLQRMF